MIAAKGKPIIVAYSDPAGNEKGTIYQSCNFLYTGITSGSQRYRDPDGKLHNTRQIHGLTRDRRNGELNYTRTRAEQRRLSVEQGCTFEKQGGKHPPSRAKNSSAVRISGRSGDNCLMSLSLLISRSQFGCARDNQNASRDSATLLLWADMLLHSENQSVERLLPPSPAPSDQDACLPRRSAIIPVEQLD